MGMCAIGYNIFSVMPNTKKVITMYDIGTLYIKICYHSNPFNLTLP
jgi:hypothetical protein